MKKAIIMMIVVFALVVGRSAVCGSSCLASLAVESENPLFIRFMVELFFFQVL